MYPHERSLVKKLADKPFAIIGVNSDGDLDEIRKITKAKNISWRSFWNGPNGASGPISTQWNVSSWPTLYLIDAEGKIRFKNLHGAEMDDAITKLMAEIDHEVDLSNHDDEPVEESL
ncbi:MAG: TlpA family protein disulfide reductase [Mariniblastus sp.]